jgi:hypothetical protein
LVAGCPVQRIGDRGDAITRIVLVALNRVVARINDRGQALRGVIGQTSLLRQRINGLGDLIDAVVFGARIKTQRVGAIANHSKDATRRGFGAGNEHGELRQARMQAGRGRIIVICCFIDYFYLWCLTLFTVSGKRQDLTPLLLWC